MDTFTEVVESYMAAVDVAVAIIISSKKDARFLVNILT